MRQHNFWYMCVHSVWRGVLDCKTCRVCWSCSPAHLSTQNARTYTKCYATASPQLLFTFLTNFKISDFNKGHTSSLKMI